MSHTDFRPCPKCGKKGLHRRAYRFDWDECRYCGVKIGTGKDELVSKAEAFMASSPLTSKISVEIKVNREPSPENPGEGYERCSRTHDITLEQLRAIADILCSPADRMIQQSHGLMKTCSCGNRRATLEEAKKCMVLECLSDLAP